MIDVDVLKQRLLEKSQEVVGAENAAEVRKKIRELRDIATELMSAAEIEEG